MKSTEYDAHTQACIEARKDPEVVKVGSKAWIFNENRRRYTDPEPGKLYGNIIYREHWEESQVVGQTRDSWLVGASKIKVSKKTGEHKRHPWCKKIVFSLAAVDDDVWEKKHAVGVSRMLRECHDVSKIRQIAAILGYNAEDHE